MSRLFAFALTPSGQFFSFKLRNTVLQEALIRLKKKNLI